MSNTTKHIITFLLVSLMFTSISAAMQVHTEAIIVNDIATYTYTATATTETNQTEIYIGSHWNETTPETVHEFLTLVPKCPWYRDDAYNMCGQNARYTIIEAHHHGINLSEITITYVTGVMGGHRLPTFTYNGESYYLTNLYKGDTRVVNRAGLNDVVKDLMGIDRFGLNDHKVFTDEWFEKNGY